MKQHRPYHVNIPTATLTDIRIKYAQHVPTVRLVLELYLTDDLDLSGIATQLLGRTMNVNLEASQLSLPDLSGTDPTDEAHQP